MFSKDEWTQEELLRYREELKELNRDVVLVDTVLKPIDGEETVVYNPFELSNMDEGTVFVFYCDTGKTTKERLSFYKKKLPKHQCISLRGGRGYWRPHFKPLKKN